MIISRKWLEEYIDIKDYSNETLCDLITHKMIEIEANYPFVKASNLVVGKVIECVNHPNSDHLHVLKVDVSNEILQIVCGANNVKENIKVIVAKIGAVLNDDFKIKASKIRGVESNGMICSLQELGIEEKFVEEEFKNGIYILNDDAIVGSDPLEYLHFNDYIFELGLTPNRGDLLSYYGVLYDLQAILKKKFNYEVKEVIEEKKENPINIRITTDKCLKYSCRVIEDVIIKPSPMWLKSKLIKNKIRPINNVVDITNYVLLELGQPLHAFDFDKFQGENILVRAAFDEEKAVTLDNIERSLTTDDIVITNQNDIKAIAGVMGCLDSMVTNNTTKIILEAAYFNPTSIRKTSNRLNLRSDSSMRFERKVDPNRVDMALNLAANLIKELASGKVLNKINTCDYLDKSEKIVNIKISEINSCLGTSISDKEIKALLDQLDFKYQAKLDNLTISIPTRRVDIETKQDINEEIVRLYGYNNVPLTMPKTSQIGRLSLKQKRVRLIRDALLGFGIDETINYSLLSKDELYKYVLNKQGEVKILSSLSEKRECMRQSLLNGLLETYNYNKARQMENIKIFEIGKTYTFDKEDLKLGLVLEGTYNESLWQGKKEAVDFFLVKGMLNEIFTKLNVANDITYVAYDLENSSYFKQKTAKILYKNEVIGILGSLDIRMKEYKNVIVSEINLEPLLNSQKEQIIFAAINRFPKITRDLSIVVDNSVLAINLVNTIKEIGKNKLTSIKIFDVFNDEKLGINKKSIAFKLTFEDNEKTLESKDVDDLINKILKKLDQTYNASIRAI